MSKSLSLLFITSDATHKYKMFSFSSEVGEDLIQEVLRDFWRHTPRDYQTEAIKAVVKLLDDVDVLAIPH